MTNRRLIFAQMTDVLVKQHVEQMRAQARGQGSGFFGQWGAQLKASSQFAQRYFQMPPDWIAAETQGNFSVGPGDVRQVRVERKTRGASSDDLGTDFLRITIEWPSGSRTWDTDHEQPSASEARQMLAYTFGQLVR